MDKDSGNIELPSADEGYQTLLRGLAAESNPGDMTDIAGAHNPSDSLKDPDLHGNQNKKYVHSDKRRNLWA